MPQRLESYVICGTPRSGSTLLCKMLAATGVAGRPGSFFREPDVEHWADRWDVAHPDGTATAEFNRQYIAAMLRGGRAGTDIFGLRIMWGSVASAASRFDAAFGNGADITERFDTAFGRPLYIHLSRNDKLAQAISLLRAEQSGLWHLAADGSVLEGEAIQAPVTYDEARIAALVEERTSDDAAWTGFFVDRGIEPLRLTYESISANPPAALAEVLAALGLDPAITATVAVPTAKIADATSTAWAERYRAGRPS